MCETASRNCKQPVAWTGQLPDDTGVMMTVLENKWLRPPVRSLAGTVLRHRPATLLITLPAQVDESNAAEIRANLMAAAERRPYVLIADMSATRWCDWAGAGALASTFSRAATGGTELRLVLTDESVRRVIAINGLTQVLPIFDDVTSASATPLAS